MTGRCFIAVAGAVTIMIGVAISAGSELLRPAGNWGAAIGAMLVIAACCLEDDRCVTCSPFPSPTKEDDR